MGTQWHTMINLEQPDDKDKLIKVANKLKTSRSKLIGSIIRKLIIVNGEDNG